MSTDATESVAKWISLFVERDHAFELRALGCGKYGSVISGYFDAAHTLDAAREALRLSAEGAAGVYFTFNPLKPDTLARRSNRVDRSPKEFRQATDSDVASRRWLLIDCDPIRTAGVSSTDAEHAASLATAEAIFGYLSAERGWPLPIVADSGNGTHLLYRIDMPADDDTIIKRCLKALAKRFTSATVDIDTSVFNPARICKFYGTVGRKGDSTPDRPHRRSRILQVPRGIVPVSTELLKSLAAEAPADQPVRKPAKLPANSNTERCRAYVAKMEPAVSGEHGHDQTYNAACVIAKDYELPFDYGWPILCEFNDRGQPPFDEVKLRKKWDDAEASPGERGRLSRGTQTTPVGSNTTFDPLPMPVESPPFDADDPLSSLSFVEPIEQASPNDITPPQRCKIEIRDNEEYITNDQAVSALALDPDIYSRGGRLVRAIIESGTASISTITAPSIRERLSKVAEFVRTTILKDGTRTEASENPPEWCYRAVEARGTWQGIRPLKGIVESPVLRRDGSILNQPGYDSATGLLYAPHESLTLSVPAAPSQQDARDAVESLLYIVSDFPFDKLEHRSSWVALILTIISHHAFRGPAPLFLVDGNTRGCGKGMVVDAAVLIALGRTPSRMTNPKNDEEVRKKIMSIALRGDPVSFFDNVDGKFGCAEFDSVITAEDWSDRILGGMEMKSVPLSTTWVTSGNNIMLTGDMVRRVCHARLNSPDENPEQRSDFKIPKLLDHVRHNRSKLLSAAFTILRAFIAAGRPSQSLKPWGSFEGWSDLVRDSLVWAGMTDPGESRQNLAALSDTSIGGIAELIHCFGGSDGLDPFGHGLTAKEIVKIVENFPQAYSIAHEAIMEICNTKVGSPLSPRSLASNLKRFRDKVIDGLFITSKPGHNNTLKWIVSKIEKPNPKSGGSESGNSTENNSEINNATISIYDYELQKRHEGSKRGFTTHDGGFSGGSAGVLENQNNYQKPIFVEPGVQGGSETLPELHTGTHARALHARHTHAHAHASESQNRTPLNPEPPDSERGDAWEPENLLVSADELFPFS